MGCYNSKSFLQYNNSNNRGRQHLWWPATDDGPVAGPWLPPLSSVGTWGMCFCVRLTQTIHSCIQQHCLAHTSAHVHLTALGNANGASPLFGIANDNGTYPITGIANANRVLWGEYMASPLFGIGNGIASANSSCICTSDSFWKWVRFEHFCWTTSLLS